MPPVELLMPSRRAGRPKLNDDDKKMVRLSADLVEMISWLVRLKKATDPGFTAAQLVEPLLRPQITARYAVVKSEIERIKRAQEEASRKAEREDGGS